MTKYTYIELGGEKRPLAFSKVAIARYLDETGYTVGQMNEVFQKGSNDYTGEDLVNIFRLVFHGLKDGLRLARKDGENIPENLNDFAWEDVADWLDEEETKLAEVMDTYAKAQTPAPDKKKTARKGKAKT